MFTGIIESLGQIASIEANQNNIDLFIKTSFLKELKVDQSISHNGVCLTVVEIGNETYKVTAVKETLEKSNLGSVQINDWVNLERCLLYNGRIDGHLVQGHVDTTAILTQITDENGSWVMEFIYNESNENLTVEKGSISINGVSLTVVNSQKNSFSVAIIPYTWQNTTFQYLKIGDNVNLEFDIIGKYVSKIVRNLS
jgi:riboflavin synthase